MESSLRPPAFIAAVSREVRSHYAQADREPKGHTRSYLAQFWWGELSSFHYEIWVHERNLRLELGLHFEGTSTRNAQLYRGFSRYLLEIQNELGDSIWLEEWDRGWTRIYETLPLLPLDEARVYSVAGRMCEIMDCLQPILERLLSE